jgi:septum formation protein
MNKYTIVLASSSPRRKILLHKITDNFEIIEPDAEEVEIGDPKQSALTNAIIKGKSIKTDAFGVIACDTLVALNGVIYGKPKTIKKACEMLEKLSGKTHSVFSGVYIKIADKAFSFIEESKVKFKNITKDEIISYVEKYLPLDKAGAYGIQDDVIVESYLGDYDNIVGLPTNRIREIIREYIDVKE